MRGTSSPTPVQLTARSSWPMQMSPGASADPELSHLARFCYKGILFFPIGLLQTHFPPFLEETLKSKERSHILPAPLNSAPDCYLLRSVPSFCPIPGARQEERTHQQTFPPADPIRFSVTGVSLKSSCGIVTGPFCQCHNTFPDALATPIPASPPPHLFLSNYEEQKSSHDP